jgi:ribonuclease Z
MKVTILGNNSALPAYGRFPTAQVVDINEQLFLMDCGEGTQMRMQQFGIRSQRINHIFISHAHGDHYFGLVGFISSMALMGRERTLFVYCTAVVKSVIELQIPWQLSFEIVYHLLQENETALLLQHDKYEVHCFPVYHSIPTHGFLFTEKKRKRILLPEKLKEYEVPKYFYSRLTEGEDYVGRDGQVISNDWVTMPGLPAKKYAFCADTVFNIEICTHFMGADLVYHEATYLQDNLQKAKDRLHSTAMEAATIAKTAECKRLIIGHFSSKYKDLLPFKEEARSVFLNTDLALEGELFEI